MVDSRLRALIVIGDVNFVQSEDIWFNAPRKGVLVFALPGERCVADITGDFKIQFSDRHGDFYWYSHLPSCLKVAILYNEENFQLRLWDCSCGLRLTCEYRLFPSGWDILQNLVQLFVGLQLTVMFILQLVEHKYDGDETDTRNLRS